MYIYLAETNELHLLHSLVYEPDTTNLIVNKDITIECETIETAEELYRYIMINVENKGQNMVSVFSNGKCNGGYHQKPLEIPDQPF